MDAQYDVTTVQGRSTLWLDSDRIDDCMNHFKDQGIDILGVNPMRGFKEKDLSFLDKYQWVHGLLLVPPASHDFDLSPVLGLKKLRDLTLNQECSLSLASFPELEAFRGNWDEGLNLAQCPKLSVLSITGFKPGIDLEKFPAPPSLTDLGLIQSPITSLAGISRMKRLRRLELAYLPKLEKLDDLAELADLQFLDLNKCKKIKNHSIVSQLKNLTVLRFNDCGTIPNLQFIDEMKCLEEFRFVNTLIEDGDLHPLLRLKRVGFLPKKGYSHSPKDFVSVDS